MVYEIFEQFEFEKFGLIAENEGDDDNHEKPV
jgi:hypothetical protein